MAFLLSSCVGTATPATSTSKNQIMLRATPQPLFVHEGAVVQAFVFGDPQAKKRVLFIHGWSGSGAEFLDLAEKLTNARLDISCFVVDLPGSGSSDKPADAPYDIPYFRAVVKATLEVVATYGLAPGDSAEDITLVGHSLGGHICVDYAARDGNGITRLALISPAGWPGEVGVISEWAARNTLILGIAPKLITEETYLGGYRLMMVANGASYSEAAVRYTGRALETPEAKAALKLITLNALERDYIDGLLSSIRVPVFLLWGRNDMVLPFSYAEKFMGGLPPGTRFAAFDGCGHMPHVERAPELSGMLSDFIGK
jgi:pimeloyl-ACP methyl ester carboxylesterase